MKYLKSIACLLAVVTMTACGESDDKPGYNTTPGITVSMPQHEVLLKENQGIVNVPVELSGETNGYVTVICEVKEYGPEVAMEDVHYLLTSKVLTFDVGEEEANFELKLVDDADLNEARQFTLTLVSAQGASLGNNVTTIVTIRDNDSNPYDRIGGEWVVPCHGYGSSSMTNVTINFQTPAETDPAYGTCYDIYGVITDKIPVRCEFAYNEVNQVATLTIDYNQTFTYDGCQGMLCYLDDEGYIINSGIVTLQWSADEPNEINFISGPQETFFDLLSVFNDGGWYILNDLMGITQMHK